MTAGIYALYWEDSDSVYIGNSINIEERYNKHKSMLAYGSHHSVKLQTKYSVCHVPPELVILEECTLKDLNHKEIAWISEFDSYYNGYNGTTGGDSGGSGVTAPNSKYSKAKVLRAFSMLYRTSLSYTEIASRVDINSSTTIRNIAKGLSNVWLQEKWPEQHYIMMTKARPRNTVGKVHSGNFKPRYKYIVVSPDGTIYPDILSIASFVATQPILLDSIKNSSVALIQIASGHFNKHKGYTCSRVLI